MNRTEKTINRETLVFYMFSAGYVNFVYNLDRKKTLSREVNVGLSLLEAVLANTLRYEYGLRLPRGNLFFEKQRKEMRIRRDLALESSECRISYRRAYSYTENEFDVKTALIEKAAWREYKTELPYISEAIEKVIYRRNFREEAVLSLGNGVVTIRGKGMKENSYTVNLDREEMGSIKKIYREQYGKSLSARRENHLADNVGYKIDRFMATIGTSPSRRKDRTLAKIYTFFLDSILERSLPYLSCFRPS